MKDWKTSAQGMLSLVIALSVSLLAVPNAVPPKVVAIATVASGVAKAVLGVLQKDATPTAKGE